jgi:F-type H+/Na+-transporting ATPase subunit alpha
MKLELAQFRELEAFAQFCSDLDAATQQQINRGRRLVQTLNQGQFDPWPFEEEAAIIWAAGNGYLDDVPVESVQKFNEGLRAQLRADRTALEAIRTSGDLADDTVETLKTSVEQFKQGFEA